MRPGYISRNYLNILFGTIAVLDLIFIFGFVNSTFDSGDSVVHYLQSAAAFKHPHYLLDHWAKPVFILLSSGFTSIFSWNGMKLFNSICILTGSLGVYTYLREKKLIAISAALLCLLSPKYLLAQSSGLTEPLFSTILIWALVAMKESRVSLSCFLISALPFVRTEGWLIIPVFALYIVLNKRWIHILTLASVTIIYCLIGWLVLKDFLWFFHSNPYQGVEKKYGSGDLNHFINQLYFFMGLIPFVLALAGIIISWFYTKGRDTFLQNALLFFSAMSILVSHSIFWWQGWFHSMGMSRVLIIIIPVLSVFAGFTIRWLIEISRQRLIAPVLIIATTSMLFSSNKAAISKRDISLSEEQKLIEKVLDSIEVNSTLYYGNHFVPMALNRDIDDPQTVELNHLKTEKINRPATIIWDSYFAVTNHEVSSDYLEKEVGLIPTDIQSTSDGKYTVRVYQIESPN